MLQFLKVNAQNGTGFELRKIDEVSVSNNVPSNYFLSCLYSLLQRVYAMKYNSKYIKLLFWVKKKKKNECQLRKAIFCLLKEGRISEKV